MLIRLFLAGMLLLVTLGGDRAAAAAPVETLPQVFKRVSGAVVVVRIGRVEARPANGKTVSLAGLGSGVLVSADGKVVTAAHVVQTADAVLVEFTSGTHVKARVIASDPAADVALLQLESVPPGVTPAKLGNSDRVEVGEEVFVVGAPLGISHTLTVGHLSARRKPGGVFGSMGLAELFQTDAAINQGNSGGPMFNRSGEVIGIVSHILSKSGGSDGLGFAVTSNTAQRLLFDEPSVWSGLEGLLLAGDMARAFNLPSSSSGLLVQRVAEGSPARQFGIRGGSIPATIADTDLLLGGDVILAVAEVELGAPDYYESIRHRLSEARKAGTTVHIKLLRGGEIVELAIDASAPR